MPFEQVMQMKVESHKKNPHIDMPIMRSRLYYTNIWDKYSFLTKDDPIDHAQKAFLESMLD